jgi:hypothetical protein
MTRCFIGTDLGDVRERLTFVDEGKSVNCELLMRSIINEVTPVR